KIPIDTIVQETTPDRFRGRVFSLYDLAFSGARVVAAALAIPLVPRLTTGQMVGVIGVAYVLWTPVLPIWAGRPRRVSLRFQAGGPLVFLPSIPVAFASPVAARGMLLLGFVTAVVLERIRHRRQAGLVVDKPLHPSGQ